MVIVDELVFSILHIYADLILTGEAGGVDDGIAVIAEVDVHGVCAVCVAENLDVAGEVQHSAAVGGDSALGGAVAADAAAGHVEAVFARHIDRAALFACGVAGHGACGHGDAALIIDRAALLRLVAGKGRVGPADSHFSVFCGIDRAAAAGFRLVFGEGAAGDVDFLCQDTAAVAGFRLVFGEGAAAHGQGRIGNEVDAAAVIGCGVAGDGDISGDIGAVDLHVSCAVNRSAVAGVVNALGADGTVAAQCCRVGQKHGDCIGNTNWNCGSTRVDCAAVAGRRSTVGDGAADGHAVVTRAHAHTAETVRRVYTAAVSGLTVCDGSVHGKGCAGR